MSILCRFKAACTLLSVLLVMFGAGLIAWDDSYISGDQKVRFKFRFDDAKARTVYLPHEFWRMPPHFYPEYKIWMQNSALASTKFRVFYRNICLYELKINDRLIDVSTLWPKQKCGWGERKVLDFSPYLRPGENKLQIVNEMRAGKSAFYLQRLRSSVFMAGGGLIISGVLLLLGVYANRLRFDRMTTAILMVAVPYFLYWFFAHDNFRYTNDLKSHLDYVRFLIKNWDSPFGYFGIEGWNPPLYYYIATVAVRLSMALHSQIDPVSAVRILSMVLYGVFCMYGLRTLRLAVPVGQLSYYMGAMLIVFWPLAPILASRVNNDIGLFAAWGALFYYLSHWQQQRDTASLRLAVGLVGITFMFKSNAIIPASFVGFNMLYALWQKQLTWRRIFQKDFLLAYGVVLFGLLVNLGRVLKYGAGGINTYYGANKNQAVHEISHFITFDWAYYWAHPFNRVPEPTFFNNLLKTMLYGEYDWRYERIALLLNGVLLLWLLLWLGLFAYMFWSRPAMRKKLAYYVIPIAISVFALMVFYWTKGWNVCQDFRYIFPVVVPLVMVYAMCLQNVKQASTAALYWVGVTVGFLLPITGLCFYLAQYLSNAF